MINTWVAENATIGSAGNFLFYMNPEVDDLISKADRMLDQAERKVLYIEAQRIAFGEYVHVPLYHAIETKGVRRRVHGFTIDPMGGIYL